eukprot:scaffold398_cov198-Alexandrium_tamarense.AAC.2
MVDDNDGMAASTSGGESTTTAAAAVNRVNNSVTSASTNTAGDAIQLTSMPEEEDPRPVSLSPEENKGINNNNNNDGGDGVDDTMAIGGGPSSKVVVVSGGGGIQIKLASTTSSSSSGMTLSSMAGKKRKRKKVIATFDEEDDEEGRSSSGGCGSGRKLELLQLNDVDNNNNIMTTVNYNATNESSPENTRMIQESNADDDDAAVTGESASYPTMTTPTTAADGDKADFSGTKDNNDDGGGHDCDIARDGEKEDLRTNHEAVAEQRVENPVVSGVHPNSSYKQPPQPSSILKNAIPPQRVMSPMPQREGFYGNDASFCSASPDAPSDYDIHESNSCGGGGEENSGLGGEGGEENSGSSNGGGSEGYQVHVMGGGLQQQQQQQQRPPHNQQPLQQQQVGMPQHHLPHYQHQQLRTVQNQQQHQQQQQQQQSGQLLHIQHATPLQGGGSGDSTSSEGGTLAKSGEAISDVGVSTSVAATTTNTPVQHASVNSTPKSNSMRDAAATTTETTTTTAAAGRTSPNHQPPGWRVKLYRLNMDGTWDDCGTGRIQFYYARQNHNQMQQQCGGQLGSQGQQQRQNVDVSLKQQSGEGSSAGSQDEMGGQYHQPQQNMMLSPSVFRELGEPMLCMRAEHNLPQKSGTASNNTNNMGDTENTATPNNKVLLRTRVLLHDAYQCQGGNIITWCEPFNVGQQQQQQQKEKESGGAQHNNSRASVSPPLLMGVDLALSFQDNAGCKDIWQHILDVQVRAKKLTHFWRENNAAGGGNATAGIGASNSAPSALGANTSGGGGGGVHHHAHGTTNSGRGNDSHHLHHQHPPHSPQSHGHHVHQPLSPNSPDHDALEDRQLGLVTLPHRPPLWVKDSHHHGGASSSDRTHAHIHSHHSNNRQLHSGGGSHHHHHDDRSVASSSSSARNNDDEEEEQFHEAMDEMTAVSMAAAAAASYAGGPSSNNAGGDGNETQSHAPSPLPLTREGENSAHGFNMNCDINSCGSLGYGSTMSPAQLPNPPKWSDLDSIVDVIAGGQIQQREDLLIFLSQSDCAYIKALLQLFHVGEENLEYGGLATLAVCVKSILLLNDPEIIEYVTTDVQTFEAVCAALEYDPELRERANHRWYIREQAKFRTVVKMEDEELISYIHRLFRVNYLRDTILRPTMDESSLSTLVSLAQFTQSDIIKGVIRVPQKIRNAMAKASFSEGENENYLTKVLRMLGTEIKAIRKMKWGEEDCSSNSSTIAITATPPHRMFAEDERTVSDHSSPSSPRLPTPPSSKRRASESGDSAVQTNSGDSPSSPSSAMWQQHLAPQDPSLQSRYIRRKGCLSFLKELFNMARASLQQHEKEEFIATVVSMSVQLLEGGNVGSSLACGSSDDEKSAEKAKEDTGVNAVNLLSLLGAILSDPITDMNERGASLEVLSVIAIHDPSIIRRHCLDAAAATSRDRADEKPSSLRPDPNDLKQIIFICPPDDLLQSLLFIMSTETDAGLLLQTSEIIRIILDTEMMGEQGSLGNGFLDDENDFTSGGGINGTNIWHNDSGHESSEQNAFLAMFYDRYVQWLVAPFQYKILAPRTAFPLNASLKTIVRMQQDFKNRNTAGDDSLRLVPPCAIRAAFTLEILSFCVRAHVYRMKLFVLRTRLLGTILKIVGQKSSVPMTSSDRCLILASLK